MANIIITIILIGAFALGIKESIKHFKGEGGCCGGGSSTKPKKKKLKGKILQSYTIHVDGMHCQNCANTITHVINDIEGVSASVNLHKKEVKIVSDREIDLNKIIQAIERKGYVVIER